MLYRNDLVGKRVLITGASRGLGLAIANGLASLGCQLMLVGRKAEGLKQAVDIIRSQAPTALCHVHACNIGDWAALDTLVMETCREMGGMDVLINNAGIGLGAPTLIDTSEAMYLKILQTNLMGPSRLMALAAEVMKKNPGGSIINISSMASQHPRPYLGAYAASKAGLNTMTKASALEYAPFSIRVNAVICGMFNTSALTDASASDNMKAFSKDIPLGRVAAPDEIIGTIHYLASSMSSYTTGSLIEVTGGTGL